MKEVTGLDNMIQVKDVKCMEKNNLRYVTPGILGGLFAFLAVALGAFGAHGLEGRISSGDLAIFQTAARYQMYHALALILLAVAPPELSRTWTRVSVWGFTLGILLFSGSLYALVFSGVRGLGAVTPLGGVAFLVGWVALTGAFLRRRHG